MMATVQEIPVSGSRREIRARPRHKLSAKGTRRRGSSGSATQADSFIFGVALFCSGAAALVYQVLWIKQLSLVVGIEVFSIAIGVSAFFAGLAGGGLVLGRIADRLANPLRLYFALELGIALLGVTATFLLGHAASLFTAVESHVGVLAWLIPFTLVGLPAFAMGGTIPVAICARTMRCQSVSATGGRIYALNTAGGIIGALCCPFFFLPNFGVFGTALAAASLNLAAAFTGYKLSGSRSNVKMILYEDSTTSFTRKTWIALALYTVAGSVALGYEVVWSQAIIQFLTTRSFAFSIVLATYLAGLAFGSALYGRWGKRFGDPWALFGVLIVAAGITALAEFAFLGIWQLRIQASFGEWAFATFGSQLMRMCARFFIAAAGIIFLPTALLGAAFPVALRLIVREFRTGRDIGTVVAFNTIGGILGTLLTGVLLIPERGLVKTLGLLAIVAAITGVVAVFVGSTGSKRLRIGIVAAAVVPLVGATITPADRLARLLMTTRGGGSLSFYEESKAGTVAVVQQNNGPNAFRRLFIQGVSNSGDAMPSRRYMRLQAMLPLMIHRGDPKSALVIGFGTGITAGALSQYPGLERRVCAELLPAVVRAGQLFSGNYDASKDPRLQLHFRDGRRELMRSSDKYDLITLEPPPPSAAGVVNLYSQDFYKLAATRLEPNGIFAQWLPISTQNDEDTRSLIRSFLNVFPYATLWTTELHEMLLIGSLEPIELNVIKITQRFNRPLVSSAMKEVGIASSAALLATWVMGKEGLVAYAGDASAVTDDRPRIEFSPWVRSNEMVRVLPRMLGLKTEPPLVNGNSSFDEEMYAERLNLMTFYAAGLDAYAGNRQAWARDIQEVLSRDGKNPYYRWVLGEK